jgi:hypothetical protein
MNKKLAALFSLGVMLAIIALWSIFRIPSIGKGNTLLSFAIKTILLILAFPMKLYADLVQGHGSWPIPLLVVFVALSGFIWGIILERLVAVASKAKSRKR